MTDKTRPKTRISHIIVKAIRDREGREVFNDDLAKTTKLTREQVRNSIRQLMRDHPEYGIRETSPYYYVYDPNLVPAGSAPTSAVPHIPTYEELGDGALQGLGLGSQLDRALPADRAVNPGKYPPATAPATVEVLSDVRGAVSDFVVVAEQRDVIILSGRGHLWAAKQL